MCAKPRIGGCEKSTLFEVSLLLSRGCDEVSGIGKRSEVSIWLWRSITIRDCRLGLIGATLLFIMIGVQRSAEECRRGMCLPVVVCCDDGGRKKKDRDIDLSGAAFLIRRSAAKTLSLMGRAPESGRVWSRPGASFRRQHQPNTIIHHQHPPNRHARDQLCRFRQGGA